VKSSRLSVNDGVHVVLTAPMSSKELPAVFFQSRASVVMSFQGCHMSVVGHTASSSIVDPWRVGQCGAFRDHVPAMAIWCMESMHLTEIHHLIQCRVQKAFGLRIDRRSAAQASSCRSLNRSSSSCSVTFSSNVEFQYPWYSSRS
jgi:hypothetical protein